MTTFLRNYLLSIVAVSLLSSVLLAVVPKNSIHRTLQFLCGLLLLLVTISPVVQLDLEDFSLMEITLPEPVELPDQRELMSSIIKEEAEAYIWNKANDLGYTIQADVAVTTTDDYAYPSGVTITGSLPTYAKDQLSQDIAQNLAIPKNQQEWCDDG